MIKNFDIKRKTIESLPEDYKELLYENRIHGFEQYTKEELIGCYQTVLADNVLYIRKGHWPLLKRNELIFHPHARAQIVEAVIIEGKLLKNRYGFNFTSVAYKEV